MERGIVRSAEAGDVERLLEIYAYYVRNTAITFDVEVPEAERFRAHMEEIKRRYPFLVLEQNGRIEGYACAGPFKDRAAYDWSCELTIYLSRDAQGKGLGRYLYSELEERLKRMGMLNLYACIAYPETEDAYLTRNSAEFHAHLGFVLCGRFNRCGYKFDRWYDMIWMEKQIGEHRSHQPAVVPFPETERN
ncbi:MAG: GNAT family N-acetyltransferase [Clostridia bacterium]|nr:GNAT family N-acetyltransferase [Clostridia bacterium]